MATSASEMRRWPRPQRMPVSKIGGVEMSATIHMNFARIATAALLLFVALWGLALDAQGAATDSERVTIAVARTVGTRLPKGQIVLDAAILSEENTPTVMRSSRQSRVIAKTLGASRVANVKDHVACTNTRDRCWLTNAAALVAFAQPVIAGDSASVWIRTKVRGTGAKPTINETEEIVTLRRQHGKWVVTDVHLSRVT
jgi:hypothetical protein